MRPLLKGHAMFMKNREIRIRAVKIKDADQAAAVEEHLTIDPEKIGEVTEKLMFSGHALTKDLVKYTARAAAAVAVTVIVASTVSEVIVNKSKQN